MEDPYQVLGIEPGADGEQIGQAYRTLVRRFPPELNPERFARIHRAYDLLSSCERGMEEAYRSPEAVLEMLFPLPQVRFRPLPEPPRPLQPHDFEPLVGPLCRALLERLLREEVTPALPPEAGRC